MAADNLRESLGGKGVSRDLRTFLNPIMPTDPVENRKNAMAFYDLMFNQCKPREAIERYVGATYTQHNPHVADGKEAFIAYFEEMAKQYPGKQVLFKRSVAEGRFVVLHCHQVWPTYQDKDWAGIDIFRFDDDGKVVEHWDVLQVVPGEFEASQHHVLSGNRVDFPPFA